jgi:mono/diheme cytochrome c family protein
MVAAAVLAAAGACKQHRVSGVPKTAGAAGPPRDFGDEVERYSRKLFEEGRETFRSDTFGSEAFWGEQLQLHEAIAGEGAGGVGPGLTARQALQLGLKVDLGKLDDILVEAIKASSVDLDDVGTTIALLRADAVVGVKGFFDDDDNLTSVGITCAFCHSTVDDSLTVGIGRRLDGWPNRDLDVGAIVALAPNLKPFQDLLGVDREDVVAVLKSWGPGKYDAELNQDGKAFRPDGKSAATVIPAAYGLAGQNAHTYTGWGSVPYWNAYVAVTQMHGQGTFVDDRLADREKFPLVAKTKLDDTRAEHDRVTAKLAGLHYYQLSLPPPTPPEGSYDKAAAKRGKEIFDGKARCATCHVPPLFAEPGHALHSAEEIGIDDFHAKRSPTGMYRTTPLRGVWARGKPGYYHDGRFPNLEAVVDHYSEVFDYTLTSGEKSDLVQYLLSL